MKMMISFCVDRPEPQGIQTKTRDTQKGTVETNARDKSFQNGNV